MSKYIGKYGFERWIVEKILHQKWVGMPSYAYHYLGELTNEQKRSFVKSNLREVKSHIEKPKRKGWSLEPSEGDEVQLEVNVLPPSASLEKTFVKRVKYWLVERCTPIEEGDVFVIPAEILFEADTGTWYSKETPLAKVVFTIPKGDVWVTTNTDVKVIFNPSGPKQG